MGQYKVPSNVETEDKILGPLSVKQFIYVVIGLMWGFIAIRLIAPFNIVVGLVIAAPITLTMFALGFIQREGISFENYFTASIQYFMSPRKLVWHKDEHIKSIKEAPKVVVPPERARDFSQGQLQKLAFTLDTHGAYKDDSIQLRDDTSQVQQQANRVIDAKSVQPNELAQMATPASALRPFNQTVPADDVLDSKSGRSVEVGQMLQNVEVDVHRKAIAKLQQDLAAVPNTTKSPVSPSVQQPVTGNTKTQQDIDELASRNNTPIQRLSRDAMAATLQKGVTAQIKQS